MGAIPRRQAQDRIRRAAPRGLAYWNTTPPPTGPGEAGDTWTKPRYGRIETIIASTNPAQLGRDIAIQDRLEHISRDRSEALARRNGLDMGYLGQAIERMRADAAQDKQ